MTVPDLIDAADVAMTAYDRWMEDLLLPIPPGSDDGKLGDLGRAMIALGTAVLWAKALRDDAPGSEG